MKFTQLGKSALSVSRIAFGCMSLTGDEPTSIRLLHQAIDAGINFFDTSDLYQEGQNELLLGKALITHRKDLVIATKAGNRLLPDRSGWDWCAEPTYLRSALEKSLQRLQTDYIDLFQLHGGTLEDPIDDIIALFEDLKSEGKIRAYGISSIRPAVIRQWLGRSALSSVMMQFGLLDPRPQETILTMLESHHVSLLARGVLARGLVAGKAPQPWLEWDQAAIGNYQKGYLAMDHEGRTPAQTALGYVLQQNLGNIAVVGFRTHDQLSELTYDFPVISSQNFDSLSVSLPPFVYTQHR